MYILFLSVYFYIIQSQIRKSVAAADTEKAQLAFVSVLYTCHSPICTLLTAL